MFKIGGGDSLAAIARAYGVTVAAIVEANGIQDPNAIRVGQELVIPNPTHVPTASRVTSVVSTAGVTTGAWAPGLARIEDTDPGPPFAIEVKRYVDFEVGEACRGSARFRPLRPAADRPGDLRRKP